MSNETKTAKISDILKIRDYNGTNGVTYYFNLKMDNGDVGEIGKRKRDALKAGDQLTYTIEKTQYGNKFKEVRENAGSGFSRGLQRGTTASFALAYAKDLAVANIAVSGKPMEMSPALADKITAVAGIFQKWLKENE